MSTPDQPEAGTPRTGAALSRDEVAKVAALSMLEMSPEQIEAARVHLSAVLDHMRILGSLDLGGVEPMSHPTDDADRWGEDVPAEGLSNQAMVRLAPDAWPPFIRVPKVLGDGPGG
jgi:aspartyl-tRNA(Asn)/glutamyl-tRNA(Gln) amidotransferase subunit C